MHVTAIVLAAGKGLRFKSKTQKPLARINSKPVIFYCLNVLCRHPLIKNVIVAVNPKNLQAIKDCIKKYKFSRVKNIILGAKLRQDSVRNALKAVDSAADLILIHDGVRPFISRDMVASVIGAAGKTGAAIVGVPVKATIKEAQSSKSIVQSNFVVKKTLERNNLWEAQTPQVFRRDLILKAYKKFSKTPVTDDAALVEKLGHKVRVVFGSYDNIKITTPGDLAIAKAIYGQNRNRLRYSPPY